MYGSYSLKEKVVDALTEYITDCINEIVEEEIDNFDFSQVFDGDASVRTKVQDRIEEIALEEVDAVVDSVLDTLD